MRNGKRIVGLTFVLLSAVAWAAQESDAAAPPEDAEQPAVPPMGPTPRTDESSTERKIKQLRRRTIEDFKKGGSRLTEARRSLLDLISLRPYVPEYHLALALVLRREGRLEESFRKLNDVLDLNGPKQIVYLLTAEYSMQRGNKQKALAALGRAAQSGMNIMEAVAHLPVLSHLRTDTDFVKLTLSLERFTLRSLEFPQNFRDPFLPSALWQQPETEEEDKIASAITRTGKELTKEDQATLLVHAKAALTAIERYLNTPSFEEGKAMEKYKELQEIMNQRSRISVPRISREFDAIARKLDEIETRLQDLKLRYFWEQAMDMISRMKAHFDATEYGKVQEVHIEVQKIVQAMTKASEAFEPAAQRITDVANHWGRRAQIRSAFAKKDLRILGIVTSMEDGNEANFVILDNKLLTEGDDFEDFTVEKIERNRVTFRYQGERVGLVFRRY